MQLPPPIRAQYEAVLGVRVIGKRCVVNAFRSTRSALARSRHDLCQKAALLVTPPREKGSIDPALADSGF